MKLPQGTNGWKVTPKEAIEIQRRLAGSVRVEPLPRPPRFVAGIDCAVSDDRAFSAVILWDLVERRVVESRTTHRPLEFPYIPGLLSFREIPVILDVLRLLDRTPDVLMCDGQGYAHPRRFGLACHLGVATGIPSCGCAKSRLIGVHEDPGPGRGSRAPLRDGEQIIGEVVRTRDRVKAVYVSVGHLIDLEGAVRLVLSCGEGLRLPEPTRLADRLVGEFKRSELRGR
jgi:deoxyribonuclease V